MRKLVSTKYSTGAFNLGMLILRLAVGILLTAHGYDKLQHFDTVRPHFMNFMGIGQTASLSLNIFAEFFCAILVGVGLFTRLACIPVIIVMLVIVIKVNHGNIFGNAEAAPLYLAATLALLFCGPGKISIDGMIGK